MREQQSTYNRGDHIITTNTHCLLDMYVCVCVRVCKNRELNLANLLCLLFYTLHPARTVLREA